MSGHSSLPGFVRNHTGEPFTLLPLAGDASARRYFRVKGPAGSCILCVDDTFPGPGSRTLRMLELYAGEGIPVPEVLDADEKTHSIYLRDLGDDSLESVVRLISDEEREALYGEIIDILIRVQSIPLEEVSDLEPLGSERFIREFEFFIEHFLDGYLKADTTPPEKRELERSFHRIASYLEKPEFFVTSHRDFHARNIFIHRGRPWIIDIQDSMPGLPLYDAASLLRDSYVTLEERTRQAILEYYRHEARRMGILDLDDRYFYDLFLLSAFQRNVKALGTFGYMVSRLGKDHFREAISPTLGYLERYDREHDLTRRPSEIILKMAGRLG